MPDDQLPRGIELTSLSETFRADPLAVLNAAREACPVYRDGVLRDYVVFTAEIGRKILADRTLLTDPRMSAETSTRRLRGEPLDREPPMLFADNPSHKRLRGLLGKALNTDRVERMRPRVTALCEDLIDGIAEGPFDLIAQVARPLPTIVIAQLLGVDATRHADFKRWSDQIVAANLNPLASPEVKAAGARASEELDGLVHAEIARRRTTDAGGDDLISAMIAAEIGDDRFTDAEISSQTQLLLIAGNQTTTDLIGTMVRNLLEHGNSYARLVGEPGLIANAVDEAIRFEPPIFSTERIAQEDIEVGGVTVCKGESVAVMLTALNHDPALNPRPEKFDIARQNIKHFSFGGGRHICAGAPLARLEVATLLRVMIDRMPQLSSDPTQVPVVSTSPGFRGLDEYWIVRGARR